MNEVGRWTLMIGRGSVPPRERIGGKAHSLARMANLGLRVPPAFVITTDACRAYFEAGGKLPEGLLREVRARVAELEQASGRTFGRGDHPLLVSVRSGSPVSMPGMMDTVLNLGMSDEVEQALAAESGAPGFARDTHRRFLEMFGRIVLKATFSELRSESPPSEWRAILESASGRPYPYDPYERLELAISAVFESFHSRRARKYREHQGIPHDIGTAVTVQAMVFGNLDDQSGTGVLFSRNPLTGARLPYGEYLPRAQGEDVVSGTRDPLPLEALRERLPGVHEELMAAAARLEQQEGDVQDIEFTVQRGTLFLLQARAAKRSPRAAAHLAVAFAQEGSISREEALRRVSSEQVRALLRPRLAEGAHTDAHVLARGEPAGPGVGLGRAVLSSEEAEQRRAAGERVVLIRETTSPEDIHGMLASCAVVTETGGATSHAAVVSRAFGLPCVVGAGAGACHALAGRDVTVDGDHGVVYAGLLPVVVPEEAGDLDLRQLLAWVEASAPLRAVDVRSLSPAEAAEFFELDAQAAECDRQQLTALLAGKRRARGAVLETDDGIAAAVAAGVEVVAVRHRLPALLSAIEAKRTKSSS